MRDWGLIPAVIDNADIYPMEGQKYDARAATSLFSDDTRRGDGTSIENPAKDIPTRLPHSWTCCNMRFRVHCHP